MLITEVSAFAVLVMGVVFLVVRPPFLRAMVSARLADIHHVGWEIEMLAYSGQVDRDSAYYRYFSSLCRELGSLDGKSFPGPLVWFGLLIFRRNQPRDERLSLEWATAIEESRTIYRRHGHLIRRLVADILDALRYRSLLVWMVVKVLDSVRGGTEVMLFLADYVTIRPERLVGVVLHRRVLSQS